MNWNMIRGKIQRFLAGPAGYVLLCYFLLPPPIQEKLFMRRTYLPAYVIGVGVIACCLRGGKILRRSLRFGVALAAFPAWLFIVHFALTREVHFQALNTLIVSSAVFALLTGRSHDTKIKFWKFYYYYTAALVVANLACQILWPAGFAQDAEWASWQSNYLLSNPNSFIFYYILPLAIDAVMTSLRGAKASVSFYILAALEILSFLLCGDASSTTGMLLVVFIALIVTVRDVPVIRTVLDWCVRNTHWVLLAGVLGFVIAVSFNVTGALLGAVGIDAKDIGSFAYRTEIWGNALKEIAKAPVAGHGMANLNFSFSSERGGIEQSAHNNYLQILYYGGAVGAVLYIVVVWHAVKKLRRLLDINRNAAVSYAAGLVGFLVAFLVEQNPFANTFYYYLLFSVFLVDCAARVRRYEENGPERAWYRRKKKGITFLAD